MEEMDEERTTLEMDRNENSRSRRENISPKERKTRKAAAKKRSIILGCMKADKTILG